MKVVNLEDKKRKDDAKLHDSILNAFKEMEQTLEDGDEKAEAMISFVKSDSGQYYTSVVVNYDDVLEMIGFIDVMKTSLHDALGD